MNNTNTAAVENEIWATIKGFDDYQVSTEGRVRSIDRIKNNRKYAGTVLKPCRSNVGYSVVMLRKNGKNVGKNVHRLVALTFLNDGNETNLDVNHINEIKSDNRLENLELISHAENIRKANIDTTKKALVAVSLETGEIKKFESFTAAQKAGFNYGRVIACARHEKSDYKGYKWFYADEFENGSVNKDAKPAVKPAAKSVTKIVYVINNSTVTIENGEK